MNIYFYIILFIMGTVFGSFYTLAVYRIPKNIDILKRHSYCPNCEHKLSFFELIPVLSYIFLGGKCKKCKQKIRIRYLLLELLGGIAFVTLGIALKLDVYNLDAQKIVIYGIIVLYLTAIIIISGIDKEYIKIDRRVLAYGIIVSILYMIYLYTVEPSSIYRYAIYLAIYAILLSIDTMLLRKKAENSYLLNLLILLNIILIMSDLHVFVITIMATIVAILMYMILYIITKKKNGNKKLYLNQIPVAFFIGGSNIASLFIMIFIDNYNFL